VDTHKARDAAIKELNRLEHVSLQTLAFQEWHETVIVSSVVDVTLVVAASVSSPLSSTDIVAP